MDVYYSINKQKKLEMCYINKKNRVRYPIRQYYEFTLSTPCHLIPVRVSRTIFSHITIFNVPLSIFPNKRTK